jgi:hypothetical protein
MFFLSLSLSLSPFSLYLFSPFFFSLSFLVQIFLFSSWWGAKRLFGRFGSVLLVHSCFPGLDWTRRCDTDAK